MMQTSFARRQDKPEPVVAEIVKEFQEAALQRRGDTAAAAAADARQVRDRALADAVPGSRRPEA